VPETRTNDITTYYEISGEGQPLVLIHGLGASHRMWEPQVVAFEPACRVIAYDVRGHGRSGPLRGRCDLHMMAADLKALLEHLGIDRAVICGVSFGGVVAQRFVLNFPERCAALVLTDTFSEIGRPWHSPYYFGIWLAAWLMLPFFYLPKPWLASFRKKRWARWKLAQEHAMRGSDELRRSEYIKIRTTLYRINYTPELSRINCPTLGIAGESDGFMMRSMETVMNAIPGARKEIVADAIDPTSLCQPEIFNRLVLDFLVEIGWVGTDVSMIQQR